MGMFDATCECGNAYYWFSHTRLTMLRSGKCDACWEKYEAEHPEYVEWYNAELEKERTENLNLPKAIFTKYPNDATYRIFRMSKRD